VETFVNPGDAKTKVFLNKFFAAKYGMFTCDDAKFNFGVIPYDIELI